MMMIFMHAFTVLMGIGLVFPDVIAVKHDLKEVGNRATKDVLASFRKKTSGTVYSRTIIQTIMNIIFTVISIVLSSSMFTASLGAGFGAGFSISLVGIAITLFFQWLNHWNSYKLFKEWVSIKRAENKVT